jgi:iron complex transport system ATP-binding protein
MRSIIELDSVDFQYPGRKVFAGINLALFGGEILGLIGPNSSGKTTLLRLMDGLLTPERGKVLLDGEDLRRLSRAYIARKIAVVPSAMEVPFAFTAGEIVLMGRGVYLGRWGWEKKRDWEVAREGMALTDVLELENRRFWELSQGERQRVLIARALAQEPDVILLDEPTSHLDLNHQIEIHELIRHLNAVRNLTVLNISHDLNLAAEYSHRIVMLSQSGVFCSGAPAKVITEDHIRSVYGVSAIVESNPFSGAPRVTPVSKTGISHPQNPKTIHVICGGGSGSDLIRRLLSRRIRVTLGVLNAGDSDYLIGKTLGLAMAVEAPFSPISEKAFAENRTLMACADLIILERLYVGRGNLDNLKAAVEAIQNGRRVLVLETDPAHDYTGGEAKEYYQKLRRGGAIFCVDHSQILKEVEKALS